ncbi:MAG: Histidinol-phosphate aminotransferase 2 [Elusimicrobia bacterium ADurb.Bin231]|nr:MAG: Histidinol-phosphate aminotransferase 2 [Elusimicrobia bacterium ADurb.Bin231]
MILARKNIKKFQPYVPGKPMEEVKREYKIKTVIKLASNENPLGPSPDAVRAASKILKYSHIYPDGYCFALRKKIAELYSVSGNQIIFGNGTDEIIELAGKAFLNSSDDIIVSKHAFIRYKMAGDLMGCKVIQIPMKGYTHNLAVMASAVTKRTKIVFITNPNNPTGTYNSKSELDKYFRILAAGGYDPLTFIDEAYAEYVAEKDYPLGLEYLNKGRRVIFTRTFSKMYGLAGLRIGYGVGNSDIIEDIERIRPPFNVSTVAQTAAIAALGDKKHFQRSRSLVIKQKEYLCSAFDRLGLEYVKTSANFILVNVGMSGNDVFKGLLKKGIIVRPMAEYGYINFIRVTIGTEAQNKKFIREIERILKSSS